MWNQAAVYRRRRRTLAASVLLFIVLIIVIATSGSGGGKLAPPKTHGSTGTTGLSQSPAPLSYTRVATLAEPVRASAAAPYPGKDAMLLLGGIATTDDGTAGIGEVTANSTTLVGTLPVSLFAAGAVTIGDHVYVFGGASGTQSSPVAERGILSYDPISGSAAVPEIAQLPTDDFEPGVAAIGSTVYIVGGFDGAKTLDTLDTWQPGAHASVATRLPVALRYAAVAAVDGRLVIAGGLLANNTASRRVYVYNPATRAFKTLRAELPTGIYAATAVSLGKLVYVIGGGVPTTTATGLAPRPVATIYSIDPRSGQVAAAGTLSDGPRVEAAGARVGSTIYLAGGLTTGDQTTNAVGTLTVTGAGG
jgi:hypothetical protein